MLSNISASQVLGYRLEFFEGGCAAQRTFGFVEAMLDMVVNHFALGVRDRTFDSVELLGQLKAAFAFREHGDRRAEMPLRAFQPLDDVGMAGVFHRAL